MPIPQLHSRRRWLAAFVAGCLGLPTFRVSAQTRASLQEQLEKGLRARRPVEFAFLAKVVEAVEAGRIRHALVMGIFGFVLKKYSNRKYLVPIFEAALRKRLASDGNRALDSAPRTF